MKKDFSWRYLSALFFNLNKYSFANTLCVMFYKPNTLPNTAIA